MSATWTRCVCPRAFDRRFIFCCLLTVGLAWPALAADGFTSLFNDRDPTGWDGKPGWWRVEDGAQWTGALFEHERGGIALRGEKSVIAADGARQVTLFADAAALQRGFRSNDWNDHRVVARGLGGIGGKKSGGGWYAWLGTTERTCIEQARQTVLGGARESLPFCYCGLQRTTGPKNIEALRVNMPALMQGTPLHCGETRHFPKDQRRVEGVGVKADFHAAIAVL